MAKTISDQTHAILCVDALVFHPNKFRHFGAEIEAGAHLSSKDWRYYEGNIKAVIVDYAIGGDTELAMDAAVEELRADTLEFVKSVAQCTVHPECWDLRLRCAEVLKRRFWIIPAMTRSVGTLAGR